VPIGEPMAEAMASIVVGVGVVGSARWANMRRAVGVFSGLVFVFMFMSFFILAYYSDASYQKKLQNAKHIFNIMFQPQLTDSMTLK
jgi:hypothetical protein